MSTEPARGAFALRLRMIFATLVEIAQTRLQLAATELEGERLHLTRALVHTALAMFCLCMAIVMVSAFLVVLFWDTHRLLTIGLLAAAYAVAGMAVLWRSQADTQQRPALFAATLDELRKDAEALRRHADRDAR